MSSAEQAVSPTDSNLMSENNMTNSSSHHDSEYDTASDTASSGNELYDDDEFVDDEDELGDEEDDDGSVDLDLERQRGDGEEQDGDKKKVDDDEDRSNPQYIPKRGVFYEHDDRTADEPETSTKGEGDEVTAEESKPEEVSAPPKKPVKKNSDRWSHDRFNASDQAPKSRAELVNSYGYDIRSEEGPPRARRRRRYGSGPNKYTRKWEDERAYNKMSSQQLQRNPRPDDFPELGARKSQRNNATIQEEKENNAEETLQQQSTADNNQRQRSPIRNEKLTNEKASLLKEEQPHTQLTTAERFAEKSRVNPFDSNEKHHFDGNRSLPAEHRFDGRDRHAARSGGGGGGGGRNHDRSFDNNRFDRPKNDGRFENRGRDHDRPSNDRPLNDRSQNERAFARNNNSAAPTAGFRMSKNANDFKNQSRNNQSVDGPPQQANSLLPNVNKTFGSGRTQSIDYEDDARHDSNFHNSKLERANVQTADHFNSNEFEPLAERAPGDRAITGRHGMPMGNKPVQSMHHTNSGPLPLMNNSLLGNAPQQQSSSDASHNPNNNNEVSRPKRYSALRQRSTNETAPQLPSHVQNNSMSIHDQQQQLMMQRQQQQHHLQDQMQQHPSNLATTSNYIQQTIQNNSLPTQQQLLLAAQQQPPVVAPNAQYQAAYYSNQSSSQQNEFTGSPVVPPAQQQPSPYQPQYGVVPPANAPYISAAPSQQAAYLAQQQTPPAVVQKQPGAAVNYGSNPVAAQQQQQSFNSGPTFPAYPPVANYNSVSSGITYYAPQTQPAPRPILSQRRPTNAIPILAPPERSGLKNRGDQRSTTAAGDNDDDVSNKLGGMTLGSPENIDHILDNMFVQRAPYQPPAANPVVATTTSPKEDGPQASDASAGDDNSVMKSADEAIAPIENTLLQNLNEHVLSSMTAGIVVESAKESAATTLSS